MSWHMFFTQLRSREPEEVLQCGAWISEHVSGAGVPFDGPHPQQQAGDEVDAIDAQ